MITKFFLTALSLIALTFNATAEELHARARLEGFRDRQFKAEEKLLLTLSARAERMRFFLTDIKGAEGDVVTRARVADLVSAVDRICTPALMVGTELGRIRCERAREDLTEAGKALGE